MAVMTYGTRGHPGVGASFNSRGNLVDPGSPPEPAEVEFDLYDRKGYRARWLEEKATAEDYSRITDEFLEAAEKEMEP